MPEFSAPSRRQGATVHSVTPAPAVELSKATSSPLLRPSLRDLSPTDNRAVIQRSRNGPGNGDNQEDYGFDFGDFERMSEQQLYRSSKDSLDYGRFMQKKFDPDGTKGSIPMMKYIQYRHNAIHAFTKPTNFIWNMLKKGVLKRW
jgi:hypothetical protein